MHILEALNKVQKEINAPKSQFNNFGKYHYRSVEDILTGAKKVLPPGSAVTVTDEILMMGDRHYIKATARFHHGDQVIESVGYAREALAQKGMSEPQITGGASSYARKYALGGLLIVDDTQDADSIEQPPEGKKQEPKPNPELAGLLKDFESIFKDGNVYGCQSLLGRVQDKAAFWSALTKEQKEFVTHAKAQE